jgi:hypothetical protein
MFMHWWIAVPAVGIICGAVASAYAYDAFHKRRLGLLAGFLAPLPVLCAIMLIGVPFTQDNAATLEASIGVGASLLALTSPFSLLAAWLVCHRKSRVQ